MGEISAETVLRAKLQKLISLTTANISNFVPILAKKLEKLRHFHISKLLGLSLTKSCTFSEENEKCFQKPAVVLEELLYEELHSEKWDSVTIELRDAFSALSLLKILNFLVEKESKTADFCGVSFDSPIMFADLGILMGGEELRLYLAEFASVLNNMSPFNPREPPSNLFDYNPLTPHLSIKTHSLKNPVPILSSPDILSFRHFFASNSPVLLKNAISHWPALDIDSGRCWGNINYFLKTAGKRIVPVEIGSSYVSDRLSSKLMTFSEYFDEFVVGNSDGRKKGYLAQHTLLDQITELKNDIFVPDYCHVGDAPGAVEINVWIGPRGTVSPLHFDPKCNLFAQVAGHKFLRLLPAATPSELVYAREAGFHTNTSEIVDLENYDKKAFPNFEKATYFDVILEKGDLLFIPKKWWHYVESMSVSFNVSFWFE